MKQRPYLITLLAVVFLGIAISFPMQITILYGHGINELSMLFNKISTLNILATAGLLLNAFLLWQASPALKITLPITIAIISWNNYVVGTYSHEYDTVTTSLASMGFALLCTPVMINKNIRQLLKHPESRWWLRPKRIQTNLFTQVNPYVGKSLLAKSYDLSETGMFISYDTCQIKGGHKDIIDTGLDVGDFTTLTISLSQFNIIKCDAEVVRTADETGSYPSGIGLRFVNLDHHAKGHIREYVNAQI